jgi:hypothetical protein
VRPTRPALSRGAGPLLAQMPVWYAPPTWTLFMRRLRSCRRGLHACRVLLPSMSRDTAEADRVASAHLDGIEHCALSVRLRCAECGGPVHSVSVASVTCSESRSDGTGNVGQRRQLAPATASPWRNAERPGDSGHDRRHVCSRQEDLERRHALAGLIKKYDWLAEELPEAPPLSVAWFAEPT